MKSLQSLQIMFFFTTAIF